MQDTQEGLRPEDSERREEGEGAGLRPGAARLVWSREKPMVDGFYWYRAPGQTKQSIDLVQMFTGSPCWHSAERHAWVPITWDLEWAGPIPEPSSAEGPNPLPLPSLDLEAMERWFRAGGKSITNNYGLSLIAEVRRLRERAERAEFVAVEYSHEIQMLREKGTGA